MSDAKTNIESVKPPAPAAALLWLPPPAAHSALPDPVSLAGCDLASRCLHSPGRSSELAGQSHSVTAVTTALHTIYKHISSANLMNFLFSCSHTEQNNEAAASTLAATATTTTTSTFCSAVQLFGSQRK